MDIKRGSQFRKWDLHLHSCFSWLNNQYLCDDTGKKDEKQFIEKIESSELSAIGLTNYFSFKDEDFELKKKLEERGIITFLNLEIRLSNINKTDELFDYHIIFDNTLDEKIIKNLLGELKANIGANEKSFNLLTKEEIEESANISFEKLQEILQKNRDLQGKYLTGFLARGHGSATSDKDKKNQAVYENICIQSNFIIHSSCDDSQTCRDKKCKHNNLTTDRDYWLNKSKYKMPLLQSSDSHKLDEIGSKYSWIKADLTFEGLRQILFEPEDRISLGKDNPDTKLDYQVIDFIKLDNTKKIYLNSALNTVIGGRSTGKSTFTNTIAKTLQNEHFIPIDEKTKRGMHVFDKDLTIGWRDGQEHQDLEFLPQDYMIQIAENDEKRNKLVRNTVKSDGDNYGKIEKFEEETRKNQNQIDDLIQEWSNLKEKLSILTKPEGDKKGIEVQLEKLKEQISEQEKKGDFSEQESQEYKNANIQLQSYLNHQRLSEVNIKHLKEMGNSEISLSILIPPSDDTQFNKKLSDYVELLKTEANDKWQGKIEELAKEQQRFYNENKSNVEGILTSEVFKKGQSNISNNETLKKLTDIQKEEQQKLDAFNKFENGKINIEDQISEIQNKILGNYANFERLRDQLQKDFEVKATPVEIKLDFQPIKFEDKINYLNGRNTINNRFIEQFDADSTNIINTIFNDLNLSYNQGKGQHDLIKEVLSQQWFTINYILQYDGDNFEQMSQGKKAFVVLTLILEFSKDKKPVIIDQPEDSLDNRAIYNDLTNYLKQKKRERQIILVTHNPNIVVGADAENVIVANQHSEDSPNNDGDQFDYINGALEDTYNNDLEYTLRKQGIREHVVEILEGGREAFEKREQKYK